MSTFAFESFLWAYCWAEEGRASHAAVAAAICPALCNTRQPCNRRAVLVVSWPYASIGRTAVPTLVLRCFQGTSWTPRQRACGMPGAQYALLHVGALVPRASHLRGVHQDAAEGPEGWVAGATSCSGRVPTARGKLYAAVRCSDTYPSARIVLEPAGLYVSCA